MSRRAEERRHLRYERKSDQYLASGFWPMPDARFHGVCRRCSRRTYLWRPLGLCRKCIGCARAWEWAARQFGVKL